MNVSDKTEAEPCPGCGRLFGADDRFCADCGAVRQAATRGVSVATEASTVEAPTAVESPLRSPAASLDSRPSRRLIGGIVAAMLAIVGVGVGIALAMSGGSKHTTRL